MGHEKFGSRVLQIALLVIVVASLFSGSFASNVKASPASSFYYKFTVDREGFTAVEINFSSTDTQGSSWVFVPKFTSWNHTETIGQIVFNETVETDRVVREKQYFYQAFKFRYQAANGVFKMTIKFDFDNGALIVEPRGIFYSPLIGFQSGSVGNGEVSFYSSFRANPDLVIVIGTMGNYQPTQVQSTRVFFSVPAAESQVRVQVEFSIGSSTPQYTFLKSSDNKTFTFKSVTRYQSYARDVLKLYDRIYSNFTRLFNTTLDSVTVQWFLPDFETLLTVGGFVPFTGEQLGEVNINVVFIRAVTGSVEVIAAHELVHRFIGKTGISPGNFLWFHEGMAQYISVTVILSLGYVGAEQEKQNLEDSATAVVQSTDADFSLIQLENWSPSYQPSNVDIGSLYAAAYYVISQLPQIVQREGLDYYSGFFKLINGVKINNINVLALYLSTAANASVALTLQRWGFTVTDLYTSPVKEMIQESGKAVEEVNPIFQPYKSLAEYFYQQALSSAEQGNWERARSLLQLTIVLANLAPLFTFLTILAILALIVFILHRRSRRPKTEVPPLLPPDIPQPPV